MQLRNLVVVMGICVLFAAPLVFAQAKAVNDQVIEFDDTDLKYPAERAVVAKHYAEEIKAVEKADKALGSSAELGIIISLVDLNGDGRKDIVACLIHVHYYGMNSCQIAIFLAGPGAKWKHVLEDSASLKGPISLLGKKTGGFRDIHNISTTGSKRERIWRWAGTRYKLAVYAEEGIQKKE